MLRRWLAASFGLLCTGVLALAQTLPFPAPILTYSGPSIGTPVVVGSFTAASNASSIAVPISAAIQTNDLVVAIFALDADSTPTITNVSDGTNTYTFLCTNGYGTDPQRGYLYYKDGATAVPSGNITATLSSSGTNMGRLGAAIRVSGIKTSASLDIQSPSGSSCNLNTSNVTTISLASGTLGQASEILIGGVFTNGAISAASGFTQSGPWTLAGVPYVLDLQYKIVAATTTVTWAPTWVSSRNVAQLNTFKGN